MMPTLKALLEERLAALEHSGLRRTGEAMARVPGGMLRAGEQTLVDFASNDYLGLATDPRVADAAARALADAGTGAGASRLITGSHPLHIRLEQALARFSGAPAALLFNSGYAANTGAIPALAVEGDVIYSDALNHASLIDGCRLSRAETRIFPHADLESLSRLLEADRVRDGARWIVVESLYSMDGDLFPLDGLVTLAREHGAYTYVDDAHAVGVLGETGRGGPAYWGVEGEIDVVMVTLGKAFGVAGAAVLGSATLRELLYNRCRPFVFSTAWPPALAAGAFAALEIAEHEPERRTKLWRNAARLRKGLAALGRPLPDDVSGTIAPVVIGPAAETMHVGAELRRRGFVTGSIRPPTVPEGTSRLRITVSAAHTDAQIDGLLEALADTLPK